MVHGEYLGAGKYAEKVQGTQHLYSPRGSTLVSCIVPVVVRKECGCNYAG